MMSGDSFVTKTIVALDLPFADLAAAEATIARFSSYPVAGFKVGLQAFSRLGPSLLALIQQKGFQVFLDLKYFDIPATVASAAEAAAHLGVWMVTVHAAAGESVVRACREGAERGVQGKRPLVLGVTVLTSEASTEDEVLERAKLAKRAGADGVVASALEAAALRREFGKNFILVTPGIRFVAEKKDDQVRVVTPAEALANGADYLVIGRPLLQAPSLDSILR